jgi:hypothetical protein
MEKEYNDFEPRKFIFQNLSLEKQAKNIVSLFEELDIHKNKKIKKVIKFLLPWRFNFILKILWWINDNKYIHFEKIIRKIYWLINKITIY